MPVADEPCGLPVGHPGRCRTAISVKAIGTKNAKYRQQLISERQAHVSAYKTERGCLACGYADDPVALDLDHLDPDVKVANISQMLRYAPWKAVLAELEKCQVLCAVCHRIKTMRGTAYLLAHADRKSPSSEDGGDFR